MPAGRLVPQCFSLAIPQRSAYFSHCFHNVSPSFRQRIKDDRMNSSFADVRPDIQEFTPYAPGLSIDEIRKRYGLRQVIKLASNENPLGISPFVRQVIQKHAGLAFRYPQAGNPALINALAQHHGVDAGCIACGNGSDEIIDLLIRIRAVPGKHNIVANSPCFAIYNTQAKLAGVELRKAPLCKDFSFDWQQLSSLVDANTAIVFLTAPDNPSGYCPQREDIARFAGSLPAFALLVVDEAYMDFAEDEEGSSMLPILPAHPNAAVVRTFSKSFGLAGMRVGYGILPPATADYVRRVRLPFSVNILAEEAAIAALRDAAFRAATLRAVREGRSYLENALRGLRCAVYPSQANFLMFSLPPDSGHAAQDIFEALLTRGIIIRPLKSYGLPDFLRVSVGNASENKQFINAVSKLLQA